MIDIFFIDTRTDILYAALRSDLCSYFKYLGHFEL